MGSTYEGGVPIAINWVTGRLSCTILMVIRRDSIMYSQANVNLMRQLKSYRVSIALSDQVN